MNLSFTDEQLHEHWEIMKPYFLPICVLSLIAFLSRKLQLKLSSITYNDAQLDIFFQCVKKCGLKLHFPSVGILIGFLFLLPATDFDEISRILIIFEKSSPLSPPPSPLSKVFEVDKHIQKLLGGKHRDTFTAV